MIGIYEIDLETERFINASSSVYEYLGCNREEVIGQSVDSFLTAESLKHFHQRLEKVKAGGIIDSKTEYVAVKKDGTRIPIVIDAYYRINNGKIVGAIVAVKELKDD